MPFTPVAAPQIELLQNAVDGDVFIPSFSRRAFLQGATSGLLSLAPALTMVGNLLTVEAPVRNYDLTTFSGLGLSIETTVAAGNFPVVASRDVQVKNVASTGHTYTYPTSRRVGQLLVIAVATAALTTITTPGIWTLVQSQAGTESRTSIFTRVIDGTEPSTELLAFGTASGAVVRTWMIDIGDGPVEAVAGINDSAAGTSLDLATISPTWAVSEAANTLYIAVLGLANDVTVSGFPAGYATTGQDVSASGTANVDCALAYAERSALGSSENPGAFTYAAARATGHVIAIKPKVTARLNWDGLAVRKAGSLVGTRRAVNIIDGTNITTTVTDNAGTGAVDITINAAGGGSAHTLRDDGVDMTQRAAANYVSSTSILAVLTDDAGNNETEITFQLGAHTGDVTSAANSLALTIANNAVTNAKAADMAANTVKVNNTASLGDPVDMAVSTNNFVGRLAANIVSMSGTQATTILDTFTSLLKGLAPASGGGTTNFLRADGTWAAPPDTNTGHVLRDDGVAVTQRAAANFTSSTSLTAVLTDDAGNNETEITFQLGAHTGDVTSAANSLALTIANNAVTNAKAADMAANTVKVNNTAVSGDPVDMAVSTNNFVGRLAANIVSITGTQATTILDVFTSALKGLAPASGGGTTNFLRADGTWAAPPSSLAGHIIRDNGVSATQRAALNFISSSEIDPIIGDDSVNNETEVSFSLINASVALARLANGTALSVVCRPVNSVGVHSDLTSSSDDTFLRRTAGTLSWGTLTNAMVPDNEISLTKTADWTEQVESGAGPFNDYARTNPVGALILTNASLKQLTGMQTDNTGPGRMHLVESINGSTDIIDNSASTATVNNRFAHYRDKDIRLGDEEAALYTRVDVNGAVARRWKCLSHRWPFHNSSSLLDKQKIAYNSTVGDWEVSHSLMKSANHYELWEDFDGYENSNPEINTTSVPYHMGNTQWFARSGGVGTGDLTFISGEASHPGILRMSTGSSSGTFVTIHRASGNHLGAIIAGQDILDFEAVVRFVDFGLGNVACSIGFSEDPSSVAITGTGNSNIIAFMYDTSNASLNTSIRCVTREADGVATVTASGVAPTTWAKLRILQRTVGTVEFYINDNLVATHSTQTPDTELMNMGLTVVTRTADIRDMDVDYVGMISQPLNRF